MLKGPGVWNGQEFGKNEVYRVFGWLSAGTNEVGVLSRVDLLYQEKVWSRKAVLEQILLEFEGE